MADHLLTLQTSHRFRGHSAIGRLAAAINDGNAEAALGLAAEGQGEIRWWAPDARQLRSAVVEAALGHHDRLLETEDPAEALRRLQARCLLRALRRGPHGSETLNRQITQALIERHGLDPGQRWYHGRPVLSIRNDYRVGLYNGDTGVCLRDTSGQPRVWFTTEDGARALLPSELPEHETAYAMTVHKSQGSEFDYVTVVLPPDNHPLLTHELLYTGITRARRSVALYATASVLASAITRSIERYSGLAKRLRS